MRGASKVLRVPRLLFMCGCSGQALNPDQGASGVTLVLEKNYGLFGSHTSSCLAPLGQAGSPRTKLRKALRGTLIEWLM